MMEQVCELTRRLRETIGDLIVGQENPLDELLAAFLAGGNVLLEGYPGLGKTLLAKCLAFTLDLEFKRVQFTPDMMPADLLGTRIFDFNENRFVFVRGPLFTDVLLADEINRTPPKTQAALLEAMEERQITMAGESHRLSDEFFVIATQNPLELEGTYPLPEAMLDRFWCKIVLDPPGPEEERAILERFETEMINHRTMASRIKPLVHKKDIKTIRALVRQVRVDASIKDYLVRIAHRTRTDASLTWGLSPRATLIWMHLAKAWAAMDGRDFVVPDDIKRLGLPVMRHRLILAPEAMLHLPDADTLARRLMDEIPVPT